MIHLTLQLFLIILKINKKTYILEIYTIHYKLILIIKVFKFIYNLLFWYLAFLSFSIYCLPITIKILNSNIAIIIRTNQDPKSRENCYS